MSSIVELDGVDTMLIDLVDQAIDAGVGRSFTSVTGASVKVLALDETWVVLEAEGKQVSLPKNIRKIAAAAAELRQMGIGR